MTVGVNRHKMSLRACHLPVFDRQMSVSPSVSALPSITRLLARGSDPAADRRPALHQAALERRRRHGLGAARVPTRPQGSGTRDVGRRARDADAWVPGSPPPGALRRPARRSPAIARSSWRRSHTELPELADLLRAPAVRPGAAGGRRTARWACCCWPCRAGLTPDLELAAMIGDAMVIALDRARAADELALHRDVARPDGGVRARRRDSRSR